jgi:glucokinase
MQFRIGCDIGGTNVKMGLVDERDKVVHTLILPSPSRQDPMEMVACLKQSCEALSQGRNVIGLGIGVAGVIDFAQGLVHTSPNLPKWKEVFLQKMVESRLRVRTRVDNDANVVLLGEWIAGAAKGARQAVGMTLGTGVGGALVLDGKLFRGAQGGAGEIGHTSVQADGPKCSCGNRGCLERYVGARYLVGRYLALKREKAADREGVTPAVIAERARKGDRTAVQILQEAGTWVGVACANLLNLLQPEVIVIGGGVAGAGKLLFEAIRKEVRERAYEVNWRRTRVVPGKLKERAGIIGAASLVEA